MRVGPAIDTVVDAGLRFDPKRMTDPATFDLDLFDELDRRSADYLLVGGVALLAYVEGRNTQDVDLLISPEVAGAMPWAAVIVDRDFGRASWKGVQVDLLLTTNPLFAHVSRAERCMIRFANRDVPSVTREGLLLLKLYALPSLYRQANLARAALYETDILMLHHGADVDDEKLLATLNAHVEAHDLAELRRILDEQRTRRRTFT